MAPGARPVAGANSRASSPSASVTHTTHSSPSTRKARGSRAPDTGPGGEGAGGAGAVGDPVDGAAHADGAAASGVVGGAGREPAGGAHGMRLPVDALPAEPDVEPARLGAVQVVEEPQFTGGGVDDPGAVGRGVPGVEVVEWGVPAQVGAVGQGGVERPRCPRGRRGRRCAPPPTRGYSRFPSRSACSRTNSPASRRAVPVDPQLARACRPGSASTRRPRAPWERTAAAVRRSPWATSPTGPYGRVVAGAAVEREARAQVRRRLACPWVLSARTWPSGVQPRTWVFELPQ